MRTRLFIVLAAVLLVTIVVLLPRISEAGWSKNAENETANPVQDQRSEVSVVASYHNDTSIPLRDMKPPDHGVGALDCENTQHVSCHAGRFDIPHAACRRNREEVT